MNLYTVKAEASAEKAVVLDDMILTKDYPTTAGSRMLANYKSLFDAEVVTRLRDAGYGIVGKVPVGEFAFDLLGETSAQGPILRDGALRYAAAEVLLRDEAMAAVCLDVNGAPRRAAALSGLVAVKPTYGTVSRYGTVPVACSGETVSVMAKSAAECREVLGAIAGHDKRDGTSLDDEAAKAASLPKEQAVTRIGIVSELFDTTDVETKARLSALSEALSSVGVSLSEVKLPIAAAAHEAFSILMSAELCNNVSRYDGVKFGYRASQYESIDELYTRSRTEAFGPLLKYAILFGSEVLSEKNYQKMYDKALRIRRKTAEALAALFSEVDALLLPVCSSAAFSEESVGEDKTLVFEENRYTAPASLTGLPSVVYGGCALLGPAFSEGALLSLCELLEKEGN